jgi:hypothetical protein
MYQHSLELVVNNLVFFWRSRVVTKEILVVNGEEQKDFFDIAEKGRINACKCQTDVTL